MITFRNRDHILSVRPALHSRDQNPHAGLFQASYVFFEKSKKVLIDHAGIFFRAFEIRAEPHAIQQSGYQSPIGAWPRSIELPIRKIEVSHAVQLHNLTAS